ncbi:hypothetical protein J4H92_01405 [Leucobacter weissii]|uniref:Uncharacterized protein n=1 Tax=Leucobacter weissii TaxID=1983706 RepID=A0A939MGR9_9MICO|nr:hypothetical protein [Leucobacter weissii]MBO1900603.1 hypothetical protein [Leucobacter weissii]
MNSKTFRPRSRQLGAAVGAALALALLAGGVTVPAAQAAEAVAPTISQVPRTITSTNWVGGVRQATIIGQNVHSGAAGDPTNPGFLVQVAQTGADGQPVDPASLTVTTAIEAKGTRVPPFGATPAADAVTVSAVEGSPGVRRIDFTPVDYGNANVVVTVTGEGGKTASYTIDYYASKSATPTSRQLLYSSDGSTAIDVGDGYFLLADDESPWIRLYKGDQSGLPTARFHIGYNPNTGILGSEDDFEASAWDNDDSVFWLGSQGNSRKGEVQRGRHTVYETKLTGSGKDAKISTIGSYGGLRDDLIAWDNANGQKYRFQQFSAEGQYPSGADAFNVEGAEFAPDGTTLYLGFRAPLVGGVRGGDALIVPVTNIHELTDPDRPASTRAVFGEPIELKLNGGSIREIRRNASGEYLILSKDGAVIDEDLQHTEITEPAHLWYWDGHPDTQPQQLSDEHDHALPAHVEAGANGSWEAIAEVPDRLEPGSQVRLILDQGHDYGVYRPVGVWTEAQYQGGRTKDVVPDAQRKSRSDVYTLRGALGYQLSVTGLEEPFAEQTPGTVSEPRTATITNVGRKTVPIDALSVQGDYADEFQLDPGSSAGTVLEPGDTTTATVRFAPQRGGTVSYARLHVESSAPLFTTDFSLTGIAAQGTFTAAPAPVIGASNPRVGDTLTADTGEWAPAAQFGYQWLRGSSPIRGATAASYKTVAADEGFTLAVRVTGTRAGYETKTFTSQPTPRIGAKAPARPVQETKSVTSKPSVKVATVTGKKLKVTVAANRGVTKSRLSQRATVKVAGVKGSYRVKLKNGQATVKLGKKAKRLKKGTRVRVTVTVPKLSYQVKKTTAAKVTTTKYTVPKASKKLRVRLR